VSNDRAWSRNLAVLTPSQANVKNLAWQPDWIAEDESDVDRLRRTTRPDVMSVDLVSAFAGDRARTAADDLFIRRQQKERGHVFFSDLLYAISHHYFAPEIAEALWNDILAHKRLISKRLGRNVRITVATLDYLSNITRELPAPTLISEAYIAEIANLSMRDGMTGLFNHTSCLELLGLELRSHRRYGVGVSFLLLDIDDFKSVNDRHGHQEGDRILVDLARTLVEEARSSDICCRLGGDEFAVILRSTNDPVEACEIAERLRERAAQIHCHGQSITISVGVVQCDSATTSPRALIERADRALYRAKLTGKDRVVSDATH
jgi:diguanylate cyclase (GGDEF)-like protein